MGGGPPLRSVIYFVDWAIYGRNHHPQDLPASHLTHILYAFANIRPETGEVYLTDPWADTDKHYPNDSWNEPGDNLYGCLKQLFLLKKQHRHLKVLLSIGGWTYSANFAAPASTPRGRRTFAESAVGLLEDLGLDGLDIDWEYPHTPSQANDFVELLRETRTVLEQAASKRHTQPESNPTPSSLGKAHFLLTIASPANPDIISLLPLAQISQYIDFYNLMAYDYTGPTFSPYSGHQSNLFPSLTNPRSTPFSTQAAIEHYTSQGVDPSTIVLGMPLYGRAFQSTSGPGQMHSGATGEGSWEPGVWDFKALPRRGATEYADSEVGAGYSYDPSTREMVSYDTRSASAGKADFVRDLRLGGGMWWESSGNGPVGAEEKSRHGSLVQNFVDRVGGKESLEKTWNCLEYPESRYQNLKTKFPGEGEGDA